MGILKSKAFWIGGLLAVAMPALTACGGVDVEAASKKCDLAYPSKAVTIKVDVFDDDGMDPVLCMARETQMPDSVRQDIANMKEAEADWKNVHFYYTIDITDGTIRFVFREK